MRRRVRHLFLALSPLVILPVILFITLTGFPGGGGKGDAPQTKKHGGTVVLFTISKTDRINPVLDAYTIAVSMANVIFNFPFTLNEELEYVPDLAESWWVSKDGLVWSFRLRRGVKFHDGVEMTAKDVVFTFNKIRDPETDSPRRYLYDVIEKIVQKGRYDFKVYLKKPYLPVLDIMSFAILPAHLLGENNTAFEAFGRKPVGTGPFKFSEWLPDGILLEAHEDYFAGRPYLDKVKVHFFQNSGQAWAALDRGIVDVALDLPYEDFVKIKNDPRFITYSHIGVFYNSLLFNLDDPLFSPLKLREAINLSIDRADIIEKTLFDRAVEATGPFRPGTWPFNPEVPAATHDPDRARRLLQELGWEDTDGDFILDQNGRDLCFVVLVDKGDTTDKAVAQRIRWQLFEVGIRVKVEFLEGRKLLEERLLPGKFQAALIGLNAGLNPDRRLTQIWHSQSIGGFNLSRYRNKDVDRLIEQARTSVDMAERQRLYREIHRTIASQRPAIFLFFRKKFVGISSRFAGIDPAQPILYASIKDWYPAEKPRKRSWLSLFPSLSNLFGSPTEPYLQQSRQNPSQ